MQEIFLEWQARGVEQEPCGLGISLQTQTIKWIGDQKFDDCK